MLDHLAIQCADVPTAAAFYDTVLAPLGGSRQMDFGEVLGFGTAGTPSFWGGPLADAGPNRPIHEAFISCYPRGIDFGTVVGYGTPERPSFWINPLADGVNRPVHVAFAAADRASVDAFFAAAVGAGAEVLHEPRVWPEYHPAYYGAFVRDPDGNNVEAVCHTPE